MNINHLRTLVAIDEHKSFATAAARLFLTPAAVSQQMRALEAELETAVFDRTTRPPGLNAHGTFLAERAREVLLGFDSFVDAAKHPGEIAGRLALGCINGVSTDLIPRALANLRKRYPRLRVRIEEGFSRNLPIRVRRRELDAAIVTEPPIPDPDLESLLILTEPLVVIAPPDSAARTWDQAVTGHPFLRLNRESGMAMAIDARLRRDGLAVEDAMELDSSEAILRMVEAGLGVGVVPEGRLRWEPETAVRRFSFGDPPLSRRVVLVERRNNQRSDLSQILYAELRRLTQGAAQRGGLGGAR